MHEQKCNNNELIGIKGNCESMNEVFLMGKIITDVEFKFIINSKNISIAMFKLETIKDNQKIEIKAYNEIADYVVSRLKKGDTVILNGYIDTEWKIVIKTIERNTQIKSCCIGNENFAH